MVESIINNLYGLIVILVVIGMIGTFLYSACHDNDINVLNRAKIVIVILVLIGLFASSRFDKNPESVQSSPTNITVDTNQLVSDGNLIEAERNNCNCSCGY